MEITWSRTAEGRVSLRWIEWGGPTVTPHMRRGFGTRVIEDIVAGQLNGEVHSDWRDQGLECALLLSRTLPPSARNAKRLSYRRSCFARPQRVPSIGQPLVRHEAVTHVLGTFRNPCLRAGQVFVGSGGA